MKKIITESQLKNIVIESVKKVLSEEVYKDKGFKFHEGDKVKVKTRDGKIVEGTIVNYDYSMATFKPTYDVDYLKNGKTWTMLGVPETNIKLVSEADDETYNRGFQMNKLINQIETDPEPFD